MMNTTNDDSLFAPAMPFVTGEAPDNKTEEGEGTAESYVQDLASAVDLAVREIRRVNDSTRSLALNAKIEAARAGVYGAAFRVVANELQGLSVRTTEVSNSLETVTNAKLEALTALIGGNILGTRLSDLARTNVDLIDRCLYERTCDVRWWATDSSLTNALASHDAKDISYASDRMGIILDAYTVYFDLVLCDLKGNIIANGRPSQYRSVGMNVTGALWFQQAMQTRSGNEYGFQSAHASNLVNGEPTLIYSCTVRQNGNAHAPVIGVLAVIFNWSNLALPILRNVPLSPEEKSRTERFIVDASGQILASQDSCDHFGKLQLPEFATIISQDKGFLSRPYQGKPCIIGHALAPGFETYSTGWYALLIQRQ
jgi:23S rRNA pseudoU1915 N3-methylase RlmH